MTNTANEFLKINIIALEVQKLGLDMKALTDAMKKYTGTNIIEGYWSLKRPGEYLY